MLNNNIVSGLDDIDAAIAATDEFIISDAGTIKRSDVSRLGTFLGGDGLGVSSGVLSVQVSGAVAIKSDKVALSSSIAGTGIGVNPGNAGVVTSLELDILGLDAITAVAQADLVAIHDDGAGVKKITFSNFEDQIFGNVSSDATIAAGGALTIANNAITQAKMADDAVGADELAANAVVNASVVDGSLKADKLDIDGSTDIGADLADDDLMIVDDNAAGANRKSALSRVKKYIYSAMSGDATASDSGALTIANDAVEQAMIADDAVGADQLASNAVVNASVASNAAIALSKIDTNVDMGGNFTIGSQADDVATFTGGVTIGGNLIVNGDVTSVNSATINITRSFTFEGPADDHETVLTAGSPTADTTITLPTIAAGTYHVAVLADATTAAAAAVTAAEFALLDGGSSIGTTALDKDDGFLHNDGGTMKQTKISKISDFLVSDGLTQNANKGLEVSLNGLGASKTTAAQADSLALVDSEGGNVTKKITFSNLEDQIFGNVSGDATIAAGGALTIANDAVESGMLNDNVISGQTELASGGVVDADEMMISDGGTLKKVGVDSLKVYFAGETVASKDDGDTLAVGVNYFGDHGGD